MPNRDLEAALDAEWDAVMYGSDDDYAKARKNLEQIALGSALEDVGVKGPAPATRDLAHAAFGGVLPGVIQQSSIWS